MNAILKEALYSSETENVCQQAIINDHENHKTRPEAKQFNPKSTIYALSIQNRKYK
jgi:hypothetical protein